MKPKKVCFLHSNHIHIKTISLIHLQRIKTNDSFIQRVLEWDFCAHRSLKLLDFLSTVNVTEIYVEITQELSIVEVRQLNTLIAVNVKYHSISFVAAAK